MVLLLALVQLKEQEKILYVLCTCTGAGEYKLDGKGVEEWGIDMTILNLHFFMAENDVKVVSDIRRCTAASRQERESPSTAQNRPML